jgi:hypothetical protein
MKFKRVLPKEIKSTRSGRITLGGVTLREGDVILFDGEESTVTLEVVTFQMNGPILGWNEKVRNRVRLRFRALEEACGMRAVLVSGSPTWPKAWRR